VKIGILAHLFENDADTEDWRRTTLELASVAEDLVDVIQYMQSAPEGVREIAIPVDIAYIFPGAPEGFAVETVLKLRMGTPSASEVTYGS
jgi:hypothetical protein